jgi:hypothetical protein
MSLISNRRLVVDPTTLGARDTQLVLTHTCGVQDCGKDFTVQITKLDHDLKEPAKRRYKVRCSACGKKTTFSEAQARRFARLFGVEPKILSNNFDDLFEQE